MQLTNVNMNIESSTQITFRFHYTLNYSNNSVLCHSESIKARNICKINDRDD